jgi:CheY-like chemotaxis protein
MQLDARKSTQPPRLSLLWVDDDALLRKTIKLVGTSMTKRLEVAGTPAEARAIVASGLRFDWIVCDYHLGAGTSTELVKELSAAGHRVALLTGDPDRIDPSLEVRVFAKPIALHELIDALANA